MVMLMMAAWRKCQSEAVPEGVRKQRRWQRVQHWRQQRVQNGVGETRVGQDGATVAAAAAAVDQVKESSTKRRRAERKKTKK
jgi:hypothetical protein